MENKAMMTNPVGGLTSNAAYSYMSAANSLANLAFTGGAPASLLAADKQLNAQMIGDSFRYQAYSAMQKTDDNIQKQNIKRSFSTFA